MKDNLDEEWWVKWLQPKKIHFGQYGMSFKYEWEEALLQKVYELEQEIKKLKETHV